MCLTEGDDFNIAQLWILVCWILITPWASQVKDLVFPSSLSCISLPLIPWPLLSLLLLAYLWSADCGVILYAALLPGAWAFHWTGAQES